MLGRGESKQRQIVSGRLGAHVWRVGWKETASTKGCWRKRGEHDLFTFVIFMFVFVLFLPTKLANDSPKFEPSHPFRMGLQI